ncbi:MAG: glyoxysomal fatty acid beta-oxidation multifunctional protein MFP-a [Betaproteobacteria bacterium RIFCSPLOWO2_02_FULL_65_24]|nr:MAG: glyoxysomal fatty acid beta-oxidation multifunctional protein MFP-a [Betaproteobacteria bacterium RIFCSPLOWO2_02_FULL_65_24]
MNSAARIVSVAWEGNIAVVTINNPPVNTISAGVREGVFAAAEELRARTGTAAAVLRCEGKTFLSGADIGEFSGPPKEEEYRRLFGIYENLPFPVVAAMHGTVMGGGLEFGLACHYRVCAPGTRFAFPEVGLGIIPGAGGTQRMPRLIGVANTLDMVLSTRPLDAAKALELGFIDRIIEGDLREGSLAFARELVAAGKGPRRTADRKVEAPSATDEVIARFTEQAKKQYRNREAPYTAIEAVRAAAKLPLDQGLIYETELANRSKDTVEAKALIHAFFAERETRKIPGIGRDVKPRPVRSAAIIGSGTMGGGIAICFANAGLPVTVIDPSREALDRGLGVVDKTYESMVKRGRLAAEDKARRMAMIRGTLDYEQAAAADVIIEAVFENLDLKRKVFALLDRIAKPGAVLATNTSSLDIDAIATAVKRPQDVIGLHFFSPANVMPLLEVVRTASTAPDVVQTAMELARPLKKTPVLARVCYGFIGNRMMEGYAREAERMVLEGATPRQVDATLENWGMAMGILAVFDMGGIEVGVSVHKSNADKYPPDPTYYQADLALYEAGRLGQKNGKGFYRYEPGERSRHDDPEAIEILRERAQKLGVPQRTHSQEEILERCLYPLMNEGIRILEEGVAVRASDIDVVWTAGYGFPRYRGGPMFYADTIGLKTLLDGILRYRDLFGPMHWQPAPLLEKLVREGKTLADLQGAK